MESSTLTERISVLSERIIANEVNHTVHSLYKFPQMTKALAHAAVMMKMAEIKSVVIVTLRIREGRFYHPSGKYPFVFSFLYNELAPMIMEGKIKLTSGKYKKTMTISSSATTLGKQISEAYDNKRIPVLITALDKEGKFVKKFPGNVEDGFVFYFNPTIT